MKRLYVCRHGESKLNALGRYAGQIDTPLTSLGRQQARLAGQQARTLKLDHIVASPLIRAVETAQIIAHEVGYPANRITTDVLFLERGLGELEGKSQKNNPDDPGLYPGIEPETVLDNRAANALDYLRGLEADTVLLVSHGTFLMALSRVLSDTLSEELPNAFIVEFDLKETPYAPDYFLNRQPSEI